MRFRPVLRTGACQALAMGAFVFFLSLMGARRPAELLPDSAKVQKAAVFVSMAAAKHAKPEPSKDPPRPPEAVMQHEPQEPERFRPSALKHKASPTAPKLPKARPRPTAGRQKVAAPPRDLPLSYLMKFQSMDEFHAFLDNLPTEDESSRRTMSLIRIEGLPGTVTDLRRLFKSYRMEPFLFNPRRFNYLITSDLRVIHNPERIRSHVARVGRYLRGDGRNIAYDEVRRDLVKAARAKKRVTKVLTDASEFDRMELGLASPALARFFRKLEDDTARQLGKLLGRPVDVRDIARIDCRFKDVSGVMVLVPWKAYLGTQPERGGIAIWKNG